MPRHFKVTVNGREYDVSVLELAPGESAHTPRRRRQPAPPGWPPALSQRPPQLGSPTLPRQARRGMYSPAWAAWSSRSMSASGQTVAAGDRLLVLEAMKMKSPVIATRAGQVTRVLVAPRDAVEGGQALVTIA
jgi:biotin carboxyl carrier protein